jgi:hypothetical protein
VESSKLARPNPGLRTTVGKARSSQNALKHGLLARTLILEGESASEFKRLLTDLNRDWRPQGAHERYLVETLATVNWRERRLLIAERALISRTGPFVGIRGRSEYALPMQRPLAGYDPARPDEKLVKFYGAIQRLNKLKKTLENVQEGTVLDFGFYAEIALDLCEIYGNLGRTCGQPAIIRRITEILANESTPLDDKSARAETDERVAKLLSALVWEVLRFDLAADEYKYRDALLNSQASLLLPQEHLDRLVRYETHISRLKERTIRQLERAQDRRRATSINTTIDLDPDT